MWNPHPLKMKIATGGTYTSTVTLASMTTITAGLSVKSLNSGVAFNVTGFPAVLAANTPVTLTVVGRVGATYTHPKAFGLLTVYVGQTALIPKLSIEVNVSL